jgi:hypothetical protein
MAAASAFVNLDGNRTKVISWGVEICKSFVTEDPDIVCPGMLGLQLPVFLDMFASEIISKDRICN